MSYHFTAAALPPAQRFLAYQEALRDQFRLPLNPQLGRHTSTRPFGGDIRTARSADISVARVHSDAHSVMRSDPMRLGEDCWLQINIIERGCIRLVQGGPTHMLQPGGLAVFETSQPFQWSAVEPFALWAITVPRDLLNARCLSADLRAVRIVTPSDPLVELLRGFIAGAYPLIDADARVAAAACDAVLQLVAGALNFPCQSQAVATRSATRLLARAAALIDAHLDDTGFTPTQLALRLGISRRYLQAVYQQVGSSPREAIRTRRLERCRSMLVDSDRQRLSLTAIATECGFSSLAHMSRSVRSAFGQPPSALRTERVCAE